MVREDDRAQSSTLAVGVVITLALVSALVVAGIGTTTLATSTQVAEVEEAVLAMTEFDSQTSLIALGGGDTVAVDVDAAGSGQVSVEPTGEIRLVLRNPDGTDETLSETTLGTVTYGNGDYRVAYQGGGVWRRSVGANGSVMVSPPEVHYRQGTLTLPLVNVTGADATLDGLTVEKVATVSVYPGPGGTNPVPEGRELALVVSSDYYQAWGTFFERRIGGDVSVDHANDSVTVILTAPTARFSVSSGLISVGTSDRIQMTGSGNSPTFVDAYNSTEAPWSTENRSHTQIRGSGNLKLGGNTFVFGDVNLSATVTFSGNDNLIDGNVSYQGANPNPRENQNNTITGWIAENGSGVTVPTIDGVVTDEVNRICANDTTDLLEESPHHSGEYCHDSDLTVATGDPLEFDLSDGDINVSIDGDLTVKGRITVTNVTNGTADPADDHTLRIWLGGDRVDMNSAGTVHVEEFRAPAVKLFGASDTYVKMTADSAFTGLIYAPSTLGAGGGIDMQTSTLNGSAVVGEVTLTSGSSVHYDEALSGFSFDFGGRSARELSYLHITINEVRVQQR